MGLQANVIGKGVKAAFALLFLVFQQVVGYILPGFQQGLRGFKFRFVWRVGGLHHLHNGVNGGSCYAVQLVGQLGVVGCVMVNNLK